MLLTSKVSKYFRGLAKTKKKIIKWHHHPPEGCAIIDV